MQERDERGWRKEDSEWQLTFAPSPAFLEGQLSLPFIVREPASREGINDRQQNQWCDHRRDKNRKQGAHRANGRADYGHQRNVSKAHRGTLQPYLAEPADNRDRAGADAHAKKGIPRPRKW